jgi:hypothetical protein
MITNLTDLTAVILMIVWMFYRLFVASEIFKNIKAGVYTNPDNAITIIFIEGLVYLTIVYIFFPFDRHPQGWDYIFWYVSLILFIWCFMYVIKYIFWKRRANSDEK